MSFSDSERTDLVISMTLAEIFLLLLFVIWYGYTDIISRPDNMAKLKEQISWQRNEIEGLNKKLTLAEYTIADLNKTIKILYDLIGWEDTIPPGYGDKQTIKMNLCRSNPTCNRNNVLIQAKVSHGKISMSILTEVPEFSSWTIGEEIDNLDEIKNFLQVVRTYYYSNREENGRECRFDYNLTYKSKDDYYDGRQLFERYFYPARIVRVD